MATKPKTIEDVLVRDIWGEILSRVPVKSILRCRSVCKSWYSLISCPNVISDYSNRNLNLNSRLLLQPFETKANFWSFTKSFRERSEHNHVSEQFLGPNLVIVGSCNGLICLCNVRPGFSSGLAYHGLALTLLIWNPSIRKVIVLPSRSYSSLTQYPSYFGFGFDSNTSDYKVLCIVKKSIALCKDDDFGCEIYDLGKGVWRVISPLVHSSWDATGPHPECYLNGVVHWSGRRHDNITDRIILSFDMGDEVFREIRMPDSEEFVHDGNDLDDHIHTRCVTFGGLINVIVCKVGSNGYIDVSKSCSVWAMKMYGVMESWTKMFNIDLPSARVLPNFIRLLDNDGVLMVQADKEGKRYLVFCKIGSRKCRYILSMVKGIKDLCLYEESLVLV